ncbi:hypothetical protein LPJ58_004867 [Coemansia sp. RSA 1591]|nr:hypothetical protein LPJ58_004867 [Coemansia sp. RSA 1591]KAJ2446464.1 hypothetical protein IWW46_000903 [Coemansia sp. RSA 2440]KAJ2548740.1 hypothetical protein IWW35_004057 [Coemansia sp. RSA 1878]KAJ2715884.1 hypothetical protein H4S00_004708 [Coemansia sp. D1744]
MSEEGEAEFDSGQLGEGASHTLTKDPARSGSHERSSSEHKGTKPVDADITACEADMRPRAPHNGADMSNDGYRYPDYASRYDGDMQHAGSDRRHADDEYRRRSSRSRSRPRNEAMYYDSRPMRRRESRGDEGESHGGSYKHARYGEREYQRSGYRRYESPRYKRRESGRSGYSRGGYAGREDGEGEYAGRRGIDKERAIEELRLQVRAGTDRVDDAHTPVRHRSRSTSRVVADIRRSSSRHAAGVSETELTAAHQPAATQQPADLAEGGTAEQKTPVNMDDLEEGEHVEGAMDVDMPQDTRYHTGSAEAPLRSSHNTPTERSRSRNQMHGDNSRPRSRSGSRPGAYSGPSYEMDRRPSNYRDYSGSAEGAYRRKYDDHGERHDYRPREPYGGRSGYGSRYGDNAYGQRYSNRRSPDSRDSSYRTDRRHSTRHERQSDADTHRPPLDTRSPHRQRSPLQRDDGQREQSGHDEWYRRENRSASRGRCDDRYRRDDRSASRGVPRSRSPRGYQQRTDNVEAMHDSEYRRSRYDDSHWTNKDRHESPAKHVDAAPMEGVDSRMSPPPPPPMAPYDQGRGSPYGNYSSRPQRRPSRTPKGVHGQPSSRTPYGGRYENEGHSRDPSNTHYQGFGSRVPSPGPSVPYASDPPEIPYPTFTHGTDLYITRQAECSEWLEARQNVREQTKRILELTAKTRKTGFELTYADWGVLKSDAHMQLAVWQVERAEQGLGASDRSFIDAVHSNDL